VLKNFPAEAPLREALGTLASEVAYQRWEHYWALHWTTARLPP
jgi:hypothetical protein